MQGSTRKLDVLVLLADLHKQATVERSHFYVGKVVSLAIDEIGSLRAALNIKEARPTVRPKRAVQQRKGVIHDCDVCENGTLRLSSFRSDLYKYCPWCSRELPPVA